ncbi:hypothetical protein [Streptomyces sp. NBC_01361]|uniref:hypothetical protein n=1 Tax=Streptomyces sp. NBC_01361 TaxID=2903838 RepID=UPI002E2F57FA|nr:hypothetical protein [Streptomyces sp. NBC_01361]
MTAEDATQALGVGYDGASEASALPEVVDPDRGFVGGLSAQVMLIMRWQGEEGSAALQGLLGFNLCVEAEAAGAGVALEAAAEQAHTAVLLEGPGDVATLAGTYQDRLYELHDLVRVHVTIRAERRDNDHNMGVRPGDRRTHPLGELSCRPRAPVREALSTSARQAGAT